MLEQKILIGHIKIHVLIKCTCTMRIYAREYFLISKINVQVKTEEKCTFVSLYKGPPLFNFNERFLKYCRMV